MGTRNLEAKTIVEAKTNLESIKSINIENSNDNIFVNSNLGLFYWDSSSTATPDDSNVILPNDIVIPNPGRWIRRSDWYIDGDTIYPQESGTIIESDEKIRISSESNQRVLYDVESLLTSYEVKYSFGVDTNDYIIERTDDPYGTPNIETPFFLSENAETDTFVINSTGIMLNRNISESDDDYIINIDTKGNSRSIIIHDNTIGESAEYGINGTGGFTIQTKELDQEYKFCIRDDETNVYRIAARGSVPYYNHHFNGPAEIAIDTGNIANNTVYGSSIPTFVGNLRVFEGISNAKASLECKFTVFSSTLGGSFIESPITLVKDTAASVNIYFELGTLRVQNLTGALIRVFLTVLVQRYDNT